MTTDSSTQHEYQNGRSQELSQREEQQNSFEMRDCNTPTEGTSNEVWGLSKMLVIIFGNQCGEIT